MLVGGSVPKPLFRRLASAATHRSGAILPRALALGLSDLRFLLFLQAQDILDIGLMDKVAQVLGCHIEDIIELELAEAEESRDE